MIYLKQVNDAIYKYVRPYSHPLAVRMCTSPDEIPQEAKFPILKISKSEIGIAKLVA